MPALLMHLQGALMVQNEGNLSPPFDIAAERAGWAYRLGSFLVDLPLFDRFYAKVFLHLIHSPYPESRWGTVFHKRGTASLCLALLKRARGRQEGEILALVGGLLTHIALDRAMHPLIEEAVASHIGPDETPAQLHEALENYQSLRWHRKHLGSDGLGTPLLKTNVTVGPGPSATMPTWLSSVFRSSLAEVYGTAPSSRELGKWASGVCGYRDLLSTRLSQVSIRSSETLGQRHPWIYDLEPELEDAYQSGLELAARYFSVLSARKGEAREEIIEIIGDGPLV